MQTRTQNTNHKQTETPKKRLHWMIIVIALVAVAAIIGGVILFINPPQKPYAPNTPEGVSETFIKAYYTRDYVTRFSLTYHNTRQQWEDNAVKNTGSQEQFFAISQQQADERGIEAEIHSFDDYYACYYRFIQEDMKAMFGNYTLTTEVIESTPMDTEELVRKKADLLGAVDTKYVDKAGLDTVTEGYTVNIRLTVKGTLKTHTESYLVHVILYDGRWAVISHSI